MVANCVVLIEDQRVSSTMPCSKSKVSESLLQKKLEIRRNNKPIMEKRRRARINNCLNELKTLILETTKRDPARHSKLEKADILEMTVQYLQTKKQTNSLTLEENFKAGFSFCANQIAKFPGLDLASKKKLLQHLSQSYSQQSPGFQQEEAQAQVILTNLQAILPKPINFSIYQQMSPSLLITKPVEKMENIASPESSNLTVSSTQDKDEEDLEEDYAKPLSLVVERRHEEGLGVWRPF